MVIESLEAVVYGEMLNMWYEILIKVRILDTASIPDNVDIMPDYHNYFCFNCKGCKEYEPTAMARMEQRLEELLKDVV
jgi:hypothetical protein